MKRTILIASLIVAVCVLVLFIRLIKSSRNQGTKDASASSNQAILTAQDDWESGTHTGNVVLSYGSVDLSLDPYNLCEDPNKIEVDDDELFSPKESACDNDLGTWWTITCPETGIHYWKYSNPTNPLFIGSLNLAKIGGPGSLSGPGSINLQYSDDGTDWTNIIDVTYTDYWPNPYVIDPPIETKYLRYVGNIIQGDGTDPNEFGIIEIDANPPRYGTHTSAPTQITHNDLYQWQTFTPTYTAPANTTVSFRLRTSTDSSNWTDWTAYQTPASAEALDISSLVTASTGDAGSETFYKYIQVETKLTSSDGVSTPTVDSYSIGYHTNVPPDKPTGATATVGD